TAGQGCPVVFDTVGGDVFTQSLDCVAVHGRLVTILPPPPDAPLDKLFLKNVTLALEFMGAAGIFGIRPEAQGEILLTVTELAEVGRLSPHLYATYPLADLPAAHRQQETGHTVGKLAVMVQE